MIQGNSCSAASFGSDRLGCVFSLLFRLGLASVSARGPSPGDFRFHCRSESLARCGIFRCFWIACGEVLFGVLGGAGGAAGAWAWAVGLGREREGPPGGAPGALQQARDAAAAPGVVYGAREVEVVPLA